MPVKWVRRKSALRYDTLHPVMEVWVRWGLEGSWSSMALYASKLHPARMRASFQSNGVNSGGDGGGDGEEEEEDGDDDAEARCRVVGRGDEWKGLRRLCTWDEKRSMGLKILRG